VNVALNLRFYKLLQISPVAEEILAFKEGPLRRGVNHLVKKTNQPCNTSRKHLKCLCSNTVQEDNCRSHEKTWLGIPDTSLNQAGEDSRPGHVRVGYTGLKL